MLCSRRDAFSTMLAAAAVNQLSAAQRKLGIPGPFPGRVVAVGSNNSIVSGAYQPETIRQMMHKGMMELTGAPSWVEAWKLFVQPGDVIGIKQSPVGGRKLCSDPSVLHQIIDGIRQAGILARDIVVQSQPNGKPTRPFAARSTAARSR